MATQWSGSIGKIQARSLAATTGGTAYCKPAAGGSIHVMHTCYVALQAHSAMLVPDPLTPRLHRDQQQSFMLVHCTHATRLICNGHEHMTAQLQRRRHNTTTTNHLYVLRPHNSNAPLVTCFNSKEKENSPVAHPNARVPLSCDPLLLQKRNTAWLTQQAPVLKCATALTCCNVPANGCSPKLAGSTSCTPQGC